MMSNQLLNIAMEDASSAAVSSYALLTDGPSVPDASKSGEAELSISRSELSMAIDQDEDLSMVSSNTSYSK